MSLARRWLGAVEYSQALALQKAEAAQNGPGTILGCEHPAVITLGKRAQSQSELVYLPNDISFQQTDRGGFATLHSPGQLVIYPILPLRQWGLGAREYVESLLSVTKQLLYDFGVSSFERAGAPGLYTDKGKILFVGVRIEKGVSRHGIALNVANDLNLFNCIRSCGKDNEQFDRLETPESLELLFSKWSARFETYLRSNSRSDCWSAR